MDLQKKVQELRADLTKSEAEMSAIFETAQKESRTRTTEEKSKWDALKIKADALAGEIADLDEQIKRDLAKAKAEGKVNPTTFDTPGKQDLGKDEVKNVRSAKIGNFFRAANQEMRYKLEGVEKELVDDMIKSEEYRSFSNLPGYDPSKGATIPSKVLRHLAWTPAQEKRDVTATGSGLGIELVNTMTDPSNYVEALRNYNVLMGAGVEAIQNDSGANVVFPRESSLYTAAMATAENAAATESMTSGNFINSPLTFQPKRGTGKVQVSNQALIQFGWWESYLRNQIAKGNATLMDTQGINGSGASGQARGILNTSGTLTVVGGTNGAALSRALLMEFEEDLGGAGADLGNCKFITNYAVNRKGKATEFSTGSGRYLVDSSPSWAWGNFATGKGNMSQIDQYQAFLSNNVPSNLTKGTSTTVCSAVICADITKMKFMNFGGVQIIVDPYVDAGTALTNYVVHFWFDFNVLQPNAVDFSVDILTT